MTVTALLFASYADALGRPRVDLSLSLGATVADVVAALREMPGGDRLPAKPLVAVNLAFATHGQAVSAGDEVAVIPPVAGG